MLTADTDRYSSCAGRNNDERVVSKIDQTAQKATGTKVFEVDQSCKMSDNAGIQSSEMYYTSEHSDTEITTPLDQRMVNNATCGLEKRPQKNNASVQTQAKMESDVDKQSENIPPANDGKTSKTLDQTEERNGLSITTESVSVCIEMNELIEAINGESCHTKSPSEVITNLSSGSDGESMDLESDLCRICHCSEEAEVLISPCLCTGSVKFVHHSCLMSWLQRAVMSKCELCLYPLAVKRKRKSISKWRLPEDKPFPILWLFTFVVAMTLNVASIAKDGSQQCVSNPCIIFYVLGSAGALLGLAFFYHWLRKTIRYLAKWVALNEEWTLVGPVDLRSQIGETNLAFSTKSLSDVATAQVEVT